MDWTLAIFTEVGETDDARRRAVDELKAWAAGRDDAAAFGDAGLLASRGVDAVVKAVIEAASERPRARAPAGAPTTDATLRGLLPALWADLVMWAGTQVRGADDDGGAAFWLLFGVSSCPSAGAGRGDGPMGHRDALGVVLRVVLLSLLVDADAPRALDGDELLHWLQELATWLRVNRAACRRGAEVALHAPDAWHARLLRRVLAIKLDLSVPEPAFVAATTQMVAELRAALDARPAGAAWSAELAQLLRLLRALARARIRAPR
ncbi:MAG: hypothetical protein H6704_04420 [Myxococcales bacterium]|nr:hypothetical protein [Myxococcales bacterium]